MNEEGLTVSLYKYLTPYTKEGDSFVRLARDAIDYIESHSLLLEEYEALND